jgi:hypothetical protein
MARREQNPGRGWGIILSDFFGGARCDGDTKLVRTKTSNPLCSYRFDPTREIFDMARKAPLDPLGFSGARHRFYASVDNAIEQKPVK